MGSEVIAGGRPSAGARGRPSSTSSDSVVLFPREHGAYGQLTFPLVTSLAVAGVSAPALLLALSVIAGFLAHEPLLVVLGRRGARAQRQQHRIASIGLIVTGGVALVCG